MFTYIYINSYTYVGHLEFTRERRCKYQNIKEDINIFIRI
jgi:hypothetical protein